MLSALRAPGIGEAKNGFPLTTTSPPSSLAVWGDSTHNPGCTWEGILLRGGDGGILFPAADRPNMTILTCQESELQGGLSAFHKNCAQYFGEKQVCIYMFFFLFCFLWGEVKPLPGFSKGLRTPA